MAKKPERIQVEDSNLLDLNEAFDIWKSTCSGMGRINKLENLEIFQNYYNSNASGDNDKAFKIIIDAIRQEQVYLIPDDSLGYTIQYFFHIPIKYKKADEEIQLDSVKFKKLPASQILKPIANKRGNESEISISLDMLSKVLDMPEIAYQKLQPNDFTNLSAIFGTFFSGSA